MLRSLTEQERQQFRAGPHVAVLSLPSDDERPPLAFPVWYGYEPGALITHYTIRADPPSRKLRLLRRDGGVSLCVQREELPYRYVPVEGTVVAASDAPTDAQMLAIDGRCLPEDKAHAYLRAEAAFAPALTIFSIRSGRWAGFDFAGDVP